MMEVENLTLQFGGVRPLDGVSVVFDAGTCGLIGPNGAGKTSFLNVISGFVRPVSGSIRVDGTDVLAMSPARRARWGLRRTFQTEQAIRSLSVAENVGMVLEHSSPRSRDARNTVLEAMEFVGLDISPSAPVETLGSGDRRLVEIARAVVGEPKVVLLDEPAAGLSDEESTRLGDVIRRIPERTGALVILIDHDMDLVSACCEKVAVLDFGRLLASGPTHDVLRDRVVIEAYLGTEVA
jgi:branched-chain amino acid transport system ATP-binding protein